MRGQPVAIVAIVGLGLIFAVQLGKHRAADPVMVSGGRAAVGTLAPDFSTQTLDGARVRLSQFRGKPVLINFWATWCSACEDEMPTIQRAAEPYRNQGLTVLAVNYRETNATAMRDFLQKLGARFMAVYDPEGRIATAYGVTVGLPVSAFVDRSCKVVSIHVGQMSSTLLADRVRSIL